MEKDPFKEYLRESEPDKAHKGYAWSTAIGLQAVDGLKPSKYLMKNTAVHNGCSIKHPFFLCDVVISNLSGVFINTPKEIAVDRDILIRRK